MIKGAIKVRLVEESGAGDAPAESVAMHHECYEAFCLQDTTDSKGLDYNYPEYYNSVPITSPDVPSSLPLNPSDK